MNTFRHYSFLLLIVLIGCAPKQLIEIGSVAMPHMKRPTTEQWQMVYKERVTFHQPFRTTPQIQVSLSSIEAYHHTRGTFYQLKTVNPDANGFELQIYGAYMDSFSNCVASWIAVGVR
ncbi:MAG: H-type lectin domain-containing protein [Nitrospirota bacterium]